MKQKGLRLKGPSSFFVFIELNIVEGERKTKNAKLEEYVSRYQED